MVKRVKYPNVDSSMRRGCTSEVESWHTVHPRQLTYFNESWHSTSATATLKMATSKWVDTLEQKIF